MKRLFVLLLLPLLLFTLVSCKQQQPEKPPTTAPIKPTSNVNNIYITDDGIYADMATTQYVQPQPTTLPVIPTEPPATVPFATPTEVPTTLPFSEYSAQMVLDRITAAVNAAKSEQNFSAHQLQQVEIRLTDCTLSWAVPVINGAIGIFNGPHHFDYTFVNGACADPKEDFKTTATPMSAIPPSNRLFALEAGGVVSHRAYEENGNFVYTVTLLPEKTDAQNLIPYYHAQGMDYLDLNDFDFGIGEITDSGCNYPGATVSVYVNADGKLVKYEETIPMNGSGTGSLGVSLSASFEGSMYECWTFDW